MAAGGTTNSVVIGPGRLYAAPIGTTEPASCSAALPSAWRVIGYTEEGSAFSTELTSEAIEVAEELDPIFWLNSRRTSSLALAMAEATRQNFGLALADMTAAFASNSAASFDPPDPDDTGACMLVWDKLDDLSALNVRWLFRQVKPSGTVELAHRKSPTKTVIAVTFNLEKPTSAAPFRVFPNSSGLIS